MSDQEVGIYEKFEVSRLDDKKGKHSDCFYFVLDTTHDKFAKQALLAYAMACRENYRQLSDDLLEMVLGND